MSKQFILLNPINLIVGMCDQSEIPEALTEFGCTQVTSAGNTYITSKDINSLTQMAFDLDLPGDIVEYTGYYKSTETVTEMEQE
jgi:hypothetical protein